MALEKWDTHMREYLEAGGRLLSYDEKKIALLIIVPEILRADIMLKFQGILEPMPGSFQEDQDEAFYALRNKLQKQLEMRRWI